MIVYSIKRNVTFVLRGGRCSLLLLIVACTCLSPIKTRLLLPAPACSCLLLSVAPISCLFLSAGACSCLLFPAPVCRSHQLPVPVGWCLLLPVPHHPKTAPGCSCNCRKQSGSFERYSNASLAAHPLFSRAGRRIYLGVLCTHAHTYLGVLCQSISRPQ